MKIVSVILSLACCAMISAGPLKAEALNARVYDVNFQTVWNKLIETINDSKTPIQGMDEKKGKIICQRLLINLDEFRRIGNIPSRDEAGGFKQPWLWARYRQQYQLKAMGPDQTEITVKIHLEGYNAPGGRWVTVISNGTKEKEVLDDLQLRLGQKNN